jgi:exosortase
VVRSDYRRFIVLLVLTCIAYIPTITWMVERWMGVDSYYAHGFLVPLLSWYMVWQKRQNFSSLTPAPVRIGWVVFLSGIIIHVGSSFFQVYFTSAFSLLFVLMGLILLFLGAAFLRQLFLPVFFLVFMMPLPMVAIADLNFKLKMLTSKLAGGLLNAVGMAALRSGGVIKTMNAYIVVDDACAGFRTFIALTTLATLLVYFSRSEKRRKYLLLLFPVPVALVLNVLRIVILTVVNDVFGARFATGAIHTLMGMFVFICAFLIIIRIGKTLE